MSYHYLEYRLKEDTARLTIAPGADVALGDWTTGTALATAPSLPIIFHIQAGDEGILPHFVADPIPMMSVDLVAALRSAGADNLQTFEAVVRNVVSGEVHRGCVAVNILGLVECLDDEAPEMTTYPPIDMGRARDLSLFRLASHPRRIVMHRRIKDQLVRTKLGAGLDFRAARSVIEEAEEDQVTE